MAMVLVDQECFARRDWQVGKAFGTPDRFCTADPDCELVDSNPGPFRATDRQKLKIKDRGGFLQ